MTVDFGYTNSNLTSITYEDDATSTFSYTTKNLLSTATDVDGYTISFTYNTLAYNKPNRITSVVESDDNQAGAQTIITYAYNRTVITDQTQNTLTCVFNEWGNTISAQDSEGIATFYQYATDVNSFAAKHRLLKTSKPQDTVKNLLANTSFEEGNDWVLNSASSITAKIDKSIGFHGKQSLFFQWSNGIGSVGASLGTYNVGVGSSFSFSAYLKSSSGSASIRITDDALGYAESDRIEGNSDWTRLEVTYTNTSTSMRKITLDIFLIYPGTIYMDCVQLEPGESTSRYNLITDSELSSLNGKWYSYSTSANTPSIWFGYNAPGLVANRVYIKGDPNAVQYVAQEIPISGNAGDRFVFTGWFNGYALPDYVEERFCGLKLVFNNTASTTIAHPIELRLAAQTDWQYVAGLAIAPSAYSSLTLIAEFSYNANALYIDGLQLFKEEFGEEYSYDTSGNVNTVRDSSGQETTYTYDVCNDLRETILPTNVKIKNTYDSFHKVIKSEKQHKVYNEDTSDWEWLTVEKDTYEYDIYGNVTLHTSTANSIVKSTAATYTSNGNFLSTVTDTSSNTTKYGYNLNNSTLEWIQYPNDTEATRTKYTYDDMFRLQKTTATTDQNKSMSAAYAYDGDTLTQITTPKTTYNIEYRAFGLRKSISAGGSALATYHYSHSGDIIDQDKLLKRLDYGNNDSVKYYYDDLGRIIQEDYYEDGASTATRTVTYTYDNQGALATVADSKTGCTTKYYYDTVGRITSQRETTGSIIHILRYTYDDLGQTKQLTETYKNSSTGDTKITHTEYSYEYGRINTITNSNFTSNSSSDDISEQYTYDNFDRITEKTAKYGSNIILTEKLSYSSASDYITKLDLGALGIYWYSYDANGNIISVTKGGNTTTYVYDTANQLIRENNQAAGKTWVWTYDAAGNITSKKEYAYTTSATLGTVQNTINYTYGDSSWGDLLTSYNGKTITYDAIGNPESDGTWTYNWDQGRQLASMASGFTIWTFAYDANGMRTGRAYLATLYSYTYNGSQLSRMTCGNNVMWFTYGADGSPLTINYNGTTYYYVTNLQGDVVAILNSSGTAVVNYTYDAWGKLLTTTGSMASTLGYYNPLRYRGYVYDEETELYYLESRYYNPTWGRFVNADSLLDASAGLAGYNLFAYCANNPIVYADSSGHWVETVFDLFSLGVSVVEVIINPADPWAWAGLAGDALDLIPFVTGLGEGVKGMRVVAKGADLVDDTLDTIRFAKAVDFTDDALDTIKTLDKVGDFTQSTASAGRRIHKGYKALQEGKEYAKIPGIRMDCFDGVNVFELKPYNKNALHQGVNQLIRYRNKIDHSVSLILEFY